MSNAVRYLSLLAFLAVLMPPLLYAQAGDGRINVRRIEFFGTDSIDDNVLRRELLQVEGTHINTVALEKSRLRLERLPYVESARIAQRPVKDAPDQVDILITITEAPARQYRFGGAYSESQRISGYGYFVNDNLLGTGQRLFARVDVSEFHTAGQLSHTDPYAGSARISRTVALEFRDIDQLMVDTSELEADLARARLEYSYQVAERQSIRLGLALQDAKVIASPLAADQLLYWVRNNGNPTVRGDQSFTDYLNVDFRFGWHHDTRDKKTFPDRGLEQRLSINIAGPGSEIEHYTIDYALSKYWPLRGGWTGRLKAKLGFGAKYGPDTTSLAPYLNWFAGGPNSVRGYRENTLGPKDSLGNPYGGNLFVASQIELLMPLPDKWQRHTRIGLFYDVGNVFSTENINFLDDAGQSLDYDFDLSELRQSVGIAAELRIPIGVLRLSYGVPINSDDKNANRFLRDDIDRFQIDIGVGF